MLGTTLRRRAIRGGIWGCVLALCWLLPGVAAADEDEEDEEEPSPPENSEVDSAAGHWTGTGSLFVSAGAGRGALGAELGARYYVRRFFLTSFLAQYEHLYWGYDSTKISNGVNLIGRLELTLWNDEYKRHGRIPDWTVYPLGGLLSSFTHDSQAISHGIGYRVGLGTTVAHSRIKYVWPFTAQIGYQRVYFRDHRTSGAFFMLGLGI